MTTYTAGKFTVEVSPPYPMWIKIELHGAQFPSFHHSDIADLQHCLKRAKAEVAQRLGKEEVK